MLSSNIEFLDTMVRVEKVEDNYLCIEFAVILFFVYRVLTYIAYVK